MENNEIVLSFIGCGFSANSVLYHINRFINEQNLCLKKKRIKIRLFEKRNVFGDGVSYHIENKDVLLNRPTEFMSIDHHNMAHFHNWLLKRGENPNEFEQRSKFGLYLAEVLEYSIDSLSAKGVFFEKINQAVIDLIRYENKYSIQCEKSVYDSDFVVLSTGNNNQSNIYNICEEKYINELYYDSEKINFIKPDENVFILGSSLSAVDVILKLNKKFGYSGNIYCLSRSAIIPKIRVYGQDKVNTEKFKKFVYQSQSLTIIDILKFLNQEIKTIDKKKNIRELFQCNRMDRIKLSKEIKKKFDLLQNILTSTNPYIEEIWSKLNDKEKLKFYHKFYSIYMSHRNPMPRSSAEKLLMLLEKKQLHRVQGRIKSVTKKNNIFQIETDKNQTYQADWIINATGQSKNLNENPFYVKLLNSGIISKNLIGGLNIDKKSQLCINKEGSVSKNLFAIGPKTVGSYINVNSAEMLSMKAEVIAKHLLFMTDEIREAFT